VTLVGSTAKGTFVSGDTDIDVYVITERYGEAFSEAKDIYSHGHRKQGELTIWNFDREGYDVDLVFIPPDYEKIDTLKHTEFFDDELSEEQKKEVVKGKALFKSEGVYGAEVGGIVGVAIEELIRQKGTLEEACRHLIENERDDAWLQDPVLNKDRNLLASVSRKRYSMIQEACEEYIETGDIDLRVYDFDEFRDDFEDKDIVVCNRRSDRSVDYHTAMSVCRKAGRIVKGKAKDIDFTCEAFVGEDRTAIAFEAEPRELPEKREECIPVQMKEAVEAFKNEHPDAETYEKNDQFCALVDRKVTNPHEEMGKEVCRLMEERGYEC
jgi:tRNA nucleotidyltransferase (CCA-adding enzyme)